MIESTTSTGVRATLTGSEYCGQPGVDVVLHHPQHGEIRFRAQGFGLAHGRKDVRGVLGYDSRFGRMCVTVPESDYERALADARAIGEREIAGIKGGAVPITVSYHDGEYLSGYTCYGRAGELLVDLGLAKHVSGWGIHVLDELVKLLGQSFAYEEAEEFARPALQAKAAKKREAAAEQAEKFAEAARTGKPVELDRWTEDCCECDFDCSLDIVYRMALPDGSTKVERIHTH